MKDMRCLCCLPRRGFLATAAAALTVPAVARAEPIAPAAIPALTQRAVVDVHHHFVPPAYVAAAHDQIADSLLFPAYAHWTPQATLDEMDANNVGTAILSIATSGVWFGDAAQARKLSRICNDYAAGLIQDHPGRFGLFAAVALPDTAGSLAEIAYALDELKADGIGLLTSYDGKWLGDPAFRPVMQELNRRRAVVFVHPASPACCEKLLPGVADSLLEYPTDSTRTMLSLLYSNTLRDLPDIRFIFAQNGGTMPMLVGRIMQLGHAPAAARLVPPESIPATIRRYYYETANATTRASIAAVTQVAAMENMLFGSDYPYVPLAANVSGLLGAGLDPADVQAIMHDNAVKLLPRLRA
jgi:predicted TIM-barrel fold metal-dependent hydrolase